MDLLALIQPLQAVDVIGIGEGLELKALLSELAKLRLSRMPILICLTDEMTKYARSLGFYVQSWRESTFIQLFVDVVDAISTQKHVFIGSDGLIEERKILYSISEEFYFIPKSQRLDKGLTEQKLYCEVIPKASSIVARHCLALKAQLSYIDAQTPKGFWLMELTLSSNCDRILICQQVEKIPGMLSVGSVVLTKKVSVWIDDKCICI